ncbi:MAG TPA: hypothetical protein VMZ69_01275, partial [Saprospiraceae bacterium]|nr:hypothetical protein [Saprospiraceae bacterium]
MDSVLKQQYKDVIQREEHVSLFALPWWLDSVSGPNEWEILALKDQNGITAALLPYHSTLIRGLRTITNPPMTQWLPILMIEKKAELHIENLIEGFPPYSILDVS